MEGIARRRCYFYPFLGSTQLQLLANVVTVAILAQGTSWAVAATQVFLVVFSRCVYVSWERQGKIDIDFT